MMVFWWTQNFGITKLEKRALADIGFTLDNDQYLQDMNQGCGTWPKPGRLALMKRPSPGRVRFRNGYYQEYLRTEAI